MIVKLNDTIAITKAFNDLKIYAGFHGDEYEIYKTFEDETVDYLIYLSESELKVRKVDKSHRLLLKDITDEINLKNNKGDSAIVISRIENAINKFMQIMSEEE